MAITEKSTEIGATGIEYAKPLSGLTEQKAPSSTARDDGKVYLEHNSELDVQNLVYTDADAEPEIHLRTWAAVFAMCVLAYVQLFALTGPPLILASIAQELNGVSEQTWVPNVVVFVQAVTCSIMSSASDLFQARKTIIVGSTTIAFVGAAIVPGSHSIGRLIAGQALVGFGLANIPLVFAVPSEILPRKWRPMAQASVNTASALGALTAPLILGALAQKSAHNGWRTFYWIEAGFWALAAILTFVGYRPPTRHTRLDHLGIWQKISHLDLVGSALLAIGLSLFLTGMDLGGNQFSWTNARTLTTLVVGIVVSIAFGVWEWKGTKTGIIHHELFTHNRAAGRTFALCLPIIFIEGIMSYSFIIFYPLFTSVLFESDPFLLGARTVPFWLALFIGTPIFGYISTKMRDVRWTLCVGFLINLAGTIGFATIQPGQSRNPLFFAALAGLGFGAILSQVIACVQISTPHAYLATATAVAVVSRAVGTTVIVSIYSAALTNRLNVYLPTYIAKAAANAGLPASSIPAFVQALASSQSAKLATIPGVTPAIIGSGVLALQHGYADGIRVVYMIAAPFGALACILCCFLGNLKKTMNYHVDAPVEELHAKAKTHDSSEQA